MKLQLKIMGMLTLLGLCGCTTTSQTAQLLFAPDHYDPPEVYECKQDSYVKETGGCTTDTSSGLSPIIRDVSNGTVKLNRSHSNVQKFEHRVPMSNQDFVQVAYLYLMAAESQCEKRISDINRSRTATDSGFGMLTTASAVIGTALGTTNGANAASGAAAVFNSLSSNANAFQNQIAAQYSGNIATVITRKQDEMVNKVSEITINPRTLKPVEGKENINQKLEKLLKNEGGTLNGMDKKNIAVQAQLHYELEKLNRVCTVSAGQREIGNKLSQ